VRQYKGQVAGATLFFIQAQEHPNARVVARCTSQEASDAALRLLSPGDKPQDLRDEEDPSADYAFGYDWLSVAGRRC